MILRRMGSLKVGSNMHRFQRRLESPYISLTICHSRGGGNLPFLKLMTLGEGHRLCK